MKITLEFDDRLKPILSRFLSPAMDKMRRPSQKMADEIGRADYTAVYSLLVQLDLELNMGKDAEVTIKAPSPS